MEHSSLLWVLFGISVSLGPWLVSLIGGTVYQNGLKNKLLAREKHTAQDPLTTMRAAPAGIAVTKSQLVWVSLVMSPSWFQKLIGSLNQLFGGRIGVFTDIIDLARREAKQRLREKLLAEGWDTIINLRFETSAITSNQGKGAGAEILIYGTALKY